MSELGLHDFAFVHHLVWAASFILIMSAIATMEALDAPMDYETSMHAEAIAIDAWYTAESHMDDGDLSLEERDGIEIDMEPEVAVVEYDMMEEEVHGYHGDSIDVELYDETSTHLQEHLPHDEHAVVAPPPLLDVLAEPLLPYADEVVSHPVEAILDLASQASHPPVDGVALEETVPISLYHPSNTTGESSTALHNVTGENLADLDIGLPSDPTATENVVEYAEGGNALASKEADDYAGPSRHADPAAAVKGAEAFYPIEAHLDVPHIAHSPEHIDHSADLSEHSTAAGVAVDTAGVVAMYEAVDALHDDVHEHRQEIPIENHGQTLEGYNLRSEEHDHDQPLEGHEQRLEGYDQPLEGHDQSLEGHDQPLEGHGQRLEGHDQSLEGYDQPLEGHGQRLEGHDQPLEGHGQPSGGYDHPLEGHDQLLQGHDKPPEEDGRAHDQPESVYQDHDDVPAIMLSVSTSLEPEWCLFAHPTDLSLDADAAPPAIPLILEHRRGLYYEPLITVFEALRQESLLTHDIHLSNGEMVMNVYDLGLMITEVCSPSKS